MSSDTINKLTKENTDLKIQIDQLTQKLSSSNSFSSNSQAQGIYYVKILDDTPANQKLIRDLKDSNERLKKSLNKQMRKTEQLKMSDLIEKTGKDSKEVLKKLNNQMKEIEKITTKYNEVYEKAYKLKQICMNLIHESQYLYIQEEKYTWSSLWCWLQNYPNTQKSKEI